MTKKLFPHKMTYFVNPKMAMVKISKSQGFYWISSLRIGKDKERLGRW